MKVEKIVIKLKKYIDDERKKIDIKILETVKEVQKDEILDIIKQEDDDMYQMILTGKVSGIYYKSKVFIFVFGCTNEKEALFTILHELQHGVQQRKLNISLLRQLKRRYFVEKGSSILEIDANNYASHFIRNHPNEVKEILN